MKSGKVGNGFWYWNSISGAHNTIIDHLWCFCFYVQLAVLHNLFLMKRIIMNLKKLEITFVVLIPRMYFMCEWNISSPIEWLGFPYAKCISKINFFLKKWVPSFSESSRFARRFMFYVEATRLLSTAETASLRAKYNTFEFWCFTYLQCRLTVTRVDPFEILSLSVSRLL